MTHEPRWLTSRDVEKGLALHLDPDALVRGGAIPSEGRKERCFGLHWFLCVDAGSRCGLWIPLFSRLIGDRIPLPERGRTGQVAWTTGTFHYDLRQVWNVPHAAVCQAAMAGRDFSTPGRRNLLRPDCIPMPWRAPAPTGVSRRA